VKGEGRLIWYGLPGEPVVPQVTNGQQLEMLAAKVLELIEGARGTSHASRAAIADALEIEPAMATLVLKQLLDGKRIVRRGTGRGTWYWPVAAEAKKPCKSVTKGPSMSEIERQVADGLARRAADEAATLPS
jgi:hypothetical protein